jgi:ubiquinone/menaquinone biosynthesis C-methylase UbiE
VNNWKNIWSKKTLSFSNEDLLEDLLRADGFDTGFGNYSPANWLMMVKEVAKKCEIFSGSAVLELGCGAGAFLYALKLTSKVEKLYGIDYSESLIESAKKYLSGEGEFYCSDASNIPFSDVKFDCIFSHGVFIYFQSHEYAHTVLERSYERLKSGGKLCLMDLNDMKKKELYFSERKKHYIGSEPYEIHYKGLEHLFFDRPKLVARLKKIGFKDIEFFPHHIPSYINSKFRFNLIARK